MNVKEQNLSVVKEITILETKIKKLILNNAIKGQPSATTQDQASKLVFEATKKYGKEYREKVRSAFAVAFFSWLSLVNKSVITQLPPKQNKRLEIIRIEPDIATERGDRWESEQEYRERVKRAYKRIASELAGQEPMDTTGKRVSIRSMAEVEARHEAYVERHNELVDKGVKLVWVSSHANASKRCAKWQGRLYSLDHTTGTINGIHYEPLENAVEIYVTTKSGKTYRNGLFGFNCRHDLYEYRDGSRPPKEFMPKTMQEEREIDKTMREMELEIRRTKMMVELTPVREQKVELKERAERLMRAYKQFCDKNQRSWSINRTTVIE